MKFFFGKKSKNQDKVIQSHVFFDTGPLTSTKNLKS